MSNLLYKNNLYLNKILSIVLFKEPSNFKSRDYNSYSDASFWPIVTSLVSSIMVFQFGLIYWLNNQIIDLKICITEIQKTLEETNQKLVEKERLIEELITRLNNSAISTPESFIYLNNDVLQYCLKSLGVATAVIVCGGVALFILSYAAPSLCNTKSLLPEKLITVLQDYFSFFQEKQTCYFKEKNLEWVIDIINNKNIVIKIKTTDPTLNYINASDYITSLHSKIDGIIVDIAAVEDLIAAIQPTAEQIARAAELVNAIPINL